VGPFWGYAVNARIVVKKEEEKDLSSGKVGRKGSRVSHVR